MTFKLHIPGRLKDEAPAAANPANPLIEGRRVAANDPAAAGTISGIAELATRANFEAGHESKIVSSAVGVPYRKADDLAGLPAWTDAEIVSFEKRAARSTWLGYPDATDRAERLLRRDRDADDRHLCVECLHAGPGYRCAKRDAFLLDQLQRCPNFKEKPL